MGQKGFHLQRLSHSGPFGLERQPGGTARVLTHILHFLPALVSIVCLFLFTHLLGPASLGGFGLACVLLLVLALLATSWIKSAQSTLLAEFRNSGHEAELFTTSLVLALSTSLLFSVSGLILLSRFPVPGSHTALRTGLLSLPLLALFCPLSLEGGPNQRLARRLVLTLGMATGVLLMARLKLDSSALFSGPAIIAGIWLLAAPGQFRLADLRKFNSALALRLLKTGIPSVLPRLCLPLTALAGGFIMNVLYGSFAVGVYAFGWALALCLVQLSRALLPGDVPSNLPFPMLSQRLNRFVRIALPATVMFFLLSFNLTRLALPAAWSNVASVIPWFAASAAGYGFSRYAATPLLCAGRHGRYLRLMASAVGVNLVLCLLLVPMLGLQGAAMAETLTIAMVCLSLVSAAQEHSAWRFRRADLVIPATGSIVIFGVHLGLAHLFVTSMWALLLEVLIGGAGYWAACLLADRLAVSDLPSQFGQLWRRGAAGLTRLAAVDRP
jgi:O-antigen/teichoic acid export membrane protein